MMTPHYSKKRILLLSLLCWVYIVYYSLQRDDAAALLLYNTVDAQLFHTPKYF